MKVTIDQASVAAVLLLVLALGGCAGTAGPSGLFPVDGRSPPEAVKEFDAFAQDAKNETPDFYRKGIGINPTKHFPEALKHLRPGMAEKDSNELLTTVAYLYLMDAEATLKVDPAKVDVEGDTAMIEGDALQMVVNGKTIPGQEGAAFVMKYIDNKWFVAEMKKLY